MDASTLTDRYVAAALRTVPESQRADIGAELRASIADQIDARVEAGEAQDAAERDVLTSLGHPDRLAAGYTDRPLYLVGPRFYLDWLRLLKLLMAIVLPCAAFGVAIGQMLSGAQIGQTIGAVVPVVLAAGVHVFCWTTLIFVAIERTGTRRESAVFQWTLDDLPDVKDRGAGLSELVASLVFLGLAAGAAVWDRLIGFAPAHPGLSFLDPGLWPWWITGLFALIVLEALFAIVVYMRGRWTFGLAAVNIALNVVVAVPALWLLSQGALLNPDFWTTIVPRDGEKVGSIFAILAAFGIAGIAIWDSIDGLLKARRARSGATRAACASS